MQSFTRMVTACRDGPEIVIPNELEIELILSACATGRGLVAQERGARPAVSELVERQAWGLGDMPIGEDIPCGVLGEAISVCDDWQTDGNADRFQTPEGCPRRVLGEIFCFVQYEMV